ncbi:glycine-rich domain-containing protein [Qipengyuania nanhaisediminis]|uniref:glycine-rich domain-containing protein n=1 Tax=Qipengyuania nanhaisediminis TaxID=604088 RepID=UPI0038B23E52
MSANGSAFGSALWRRLAAYQPGPADAPALGFAERLAQENRWSEGHALRVIEEYKRFAFLAATCDHEAIPSDAVDQAWHLHLTYSREYWQHFCPQVLGFDLHHGPTRGSALERARSHDHYAATLKAYEAAFGEPAPADIWPDAERRFRRDPPGFRVNPKDVMVLDRRHAILGAIAWVALGMAIAALVGAIF